MKLLRCLCVAGLAASVLAGCALVPGTSANYYKYAQVKKSPPGASQAQLEEDAASYDIIKVNRQLVRELNAAALTKQQADLAKKIDARPAQAYRLGPQDILRINVWGHPDLAPVTTATTQAGPASLPVGRTIDHRGQLFFPLVGEFQAAGLTLPELRQQLTQSLAKYIKDPQVEVEVVTFRSQRAFLSGEVKTPGIIPITDQLIRLTDAVGLAGGFTNEADLTSVVLTRQGKTISLDLESMYFSGDTNLNLYLEHGDVITIPDRQSRKVFVLGELGASAGSNNARSYVMRRGRMSLSEVIADAGGPNPFSSNAGEVFLMRQGERGQALIYQLDVSQVDALILAEQIAVKPKDIVYVSPTTATRIGRIISQFFPVLQGQATARSGGL